MAQRGTEHRDELTLKASSATMPAAFWVAFPRAAHRGHLALKPTSSITTPGRSIDVDGNPVEVITKGRHDPCVGIRATPIAEAMMAIALMDHLLRHRAQNADVQVTTRCWASADLPAPAPSLASQLPQGHHKPEHCGPPVGDSRVSGKASRSILTGAAYLLTNTCQP